MGPPMKRRHGGECIQARRGPESGAVGAGVQSDMVDRPMLSMMCGAVPAMGAGRDHRTLGKGPTRSYSRRYASFTCVCVSPSERAARVRCAGTRSGVTWDGGIDALAESEEIGDRRDPRGRLDEHPHASGGEPVEHGEARAGHCRTGFQSGDHLVVQRVQGDLDQRVGLSEEVCVPRDRRSLGHQPE